jgi:aminoglycoside phosphotransferase family enzyme
MSQGDAEMVAERYVESRLTHSGAVIMVGERAYKLKRPLRLGFLDFTDVARPSSSCAAREPAPAKGSLREARVGA